MIRRELAREQAFSANRSESATIERAREHDGPEMEMEI
jgi:hypothetical protein